jgi:large subunit ribosomal protein L31
MKTIPEYRSVAFRDLTTGDVMVTRSTVRTKETIEHQGATLPLYDLDVSSFSHPAYTGTESIRRESGQIDKYRRRYGDG